MLCEVGGLDLPTIPGIPSQSGLLREPSPDWPALMLHKHFDSNLCSNGQSLLATAYIFFSWLDLKTDRCNACGTARERQMHKAAGMEIQSRSCMWICQMPSTSPYMCSGAPASLLPQCAAGGSKLTPAPTQREPNVSILHLPFVQ